MSDDANQPSPRAILRGHASAIHAAVFVRSNERLLTGDADGFVIAWDLSIMRPRAVWRAHEKAILGLAGWQDDKVITHGRDYKLIVWQLDAVSEAHLSVAPPLEQVTVSRPQPWMLHELPVNTLNFCPFASCAAAGDVNHTAASASELLVAVPNAIVSDSIDIFHLPSQHRVHTVASGANRGMPMSLAIYHQSGRLTLASAFEDGTATVARLGSGPKGTWTTIYRSQAHSQPILSLDVAPDRSYLLTSGADALIVKHQVPGLSMGDDNDDVEEVNRASENVGLLPSKVVNTKHSGQQSLRIRSDGRIFATAGWDSMLRVYSSKTLKELAVLKWHQVGCYALCFAQVADEADPAAPVDSTSQAVSIRDRRIRDTKLAHWIAAGSKDGKISLWNIY